MESYPPPCPPTINTETDWRFVPVVVRVGELSLTLQAATLRRTGPASHQGITVDTNLSAEVWVSKKRCPHLSCCGMDLGMMHFIPLINAWDRWETWHCHVKHWRPIPDPHQLQHSGQLALHITRGSPMESTLLVKVWMNQAPSYEHWGCCPHYQSVLRFNRVAPSCLSIPGREPTLSGRCVSDRLGVINMGELFPVFSLGPSL